MAYFARIGQCRCVAWAPVAVPGVVLRRKPRCGQKIVRCDTIPNRRFLRPFSPVPHFRVRAATALAYDGPCSGGNIVLRDPIMLLEGK